MFGVVFGGKTPGAERYTSRRETGHRITDVASLTDDGLAFLNENELLAFAEESMVPLAPRVARFPARDLPTRPDATRDFLEELLPGSQCRLDAGADGDPAGVILRTADRSWIAAVRFAEYARRSADRGGGYSSGSRGGGGGDGSFADRFVPPPVSAGSELGKRLRLTWAVARGKL